MYVQFVWDEAERKVNLRDHGIDFADAKHVRIPRQKRLSASSHFDEQRVMKQKSSSRSMKTNLRRLRSMTESDVRISAEHPEFDLKHVARGIVRRGLKVVPAKASVSLRIDADVLEWFKSGGAGYQTRMNAVLRAFKEAAG